MTTPSIAPTAYAKDSTDFLKSKVSRDGNMVLAAGSVSVPSSTASGTVIGLIPFQKGARLGYGSRVHTADLDSGTSVTFDIGYVYDDNVTYTNVANAFVAASTTPQTSGMIEMTAAAGMTWQAAADGWIAITTGGGSTTTTGTVTFNLELSYDGNLL